MERCNQSNKKQRERSHLISLKKLIEKYGKMVPDLSIWLENELPEGFTVFNVKPDSLECASETPDNKYGGISKQGVEKTDKGYYSTPQQGIFAQDRHGAPD